MAKRGWEMRSKHSLDAAAEWMRKRSDALLVLIVRAEDISFAVDAEIAPSDAATMVEVRLEEMRGQLAAERAAAKEAALEKAARAKAKQMGAMG